MRPFLVLVLAACTPDLTDKAAPDGGEATDTAASDDGGGAGGAGDDGGDGTDGTDGADGADGSDGGDGADGADGAGDGADGAGDGADGAGDGADGAGDGDDGDPGPILPVEGPWSTGAFTVTDDPCSLTTFENPDNFLPDALTVSAVSATGFTLDDGTGPVSCGYSAPDFACTPTTVERDAAPGLDAVLTLDTSLSGAVLTETSIDGAVDISVTCDGSSCFLLELAGLSFPCALTGTFPMNAGG